jgi:hypothetical protein
MSQKERESLYNASPNTQSVMISNGFVDFIKHFKYLDSYISFDLTDDYDINKRLAAANKSMESLKYFWNNPYTSMRAEQLIFLEILGATNARRRAGRAGAEGQLEGWMCV